MKDQEISSLFYFFITTTETPLNDERYQSLGSCVDSKERQWLEVKKLLLLVASLINRKQDIPSAETVVDPFPVPLKNNVLYL